MRDGEASGPTPALSDSAEARVPLPSGEVHIWQADLDRAKLDLPALSALLSPDEQARAARFLRPSDRERYIAGRGLLRQLLSRYTGLPPESLRFVLGPNGKPGLSADCNPHMLQFNRTDSGSLALYAFCREQRVGIDAETIPQTFDAEAIARSFFHPHELASLLSLPDAQRLPAFFACWTRKEAYLKARGEGLAFGLSRFEVSLLPGTPPCLLETPFDPSETLRWSLYDVTVPSGYVAALAIETPASRPITIRQFEASRARKENTPL